MLFRVHIEHEIHERALELGAHSLEYREARRGYLRRPLKIEYDFWYQFYDDLDDCFDELEPWRIDEQLMRGQWDWRGFDMKFTGRRIVD